MAEGNPTGHDFRAWFVDYPATHVKAGQAVEVVPRSTVTALREALADVRDEVKRLLWDEYECEEPNDALMTWREDATPAVLARLQERAQEALDAA
jgi:hypothetical protein